MLSEFRQAMPVTRNWVYLDHAAVGPLPQVAADTIAQWGVEISQQGDTLWPQWYRGVQAARQLGAKLIHAPEELVALVPNTTCGVSLVAEGFPWRDGDNVVTLANEFPSNAYPWMNLAERGVETRRVAPAADGSVDWDELAGAIDARTRILSVSWIGFASGYRLDVAKAADLAHQRGCLLFLDAIQGLGVFPLDVQSTPVDFLAADGHKWLLGPEGAGLFYLRQEHLDLLRPVGVGWHSVRHQFDFDHIQLDLKPSASRYEGGTLNTAGFLGLAASLRLLDSVADPDTQLADPVLAVTNYACDRLRSTGAQIVGPRIPGHESGIVSFRLADVDSAAVREACLRRGIVTSCRQGCLRISPHAYNNRADVDQLIDALSFVQANGTEAT